jgi:signal transduction histidine kinase
LNDIIASVSSSIHLPEIVDTLKTVFVEKLKIPVGGIFFYDEMTNRLRMEMFWGIPGTMRNDLENFVLKSYGTGTIIHENEVTLLRNQTDYPQSSDVLLNRFLDNWQSHLCIPLFAKGEMQGIVFLIDKESAKLRNDQVSFYRTLGQQIGVATQNARLFDQVRQSHTQMKALSLRLVEVQEAERRYIARELHDQIGQELTGLKLALEMNILQSGEEPTPGALEAKSAVNKLVALVRELSLNLRPAMLDDLGLLPTLPWLFERVAKQTNIRVAFKHSGLNDRRFSMEVETTIYRIVQEALTNIARHAKVNEAVVRLWSDENSIGVQIEDSGVGFEADAVPEAGNTSGLRGMRERAMLLGGSFTIETQLGRGTRVTAELPISDDGRRL